MRCANEVLSFLMLRRSGIAMQLMPARNGCELAVYDAGGVVTEEFRTFALALRKADRLNRVRSEKPHRKRRRSTR